jgi:DNA polymerase III subunit epsilon
MYMPNFLDGFDRLVAFDAETTGKRTPDAEFIRKQPFAWRAPGIIIEVGFVEMLREGEGWRKGEVWNSRVNPDGPIDPEAIKIHRIRPADLKNAPRFPTILPKVKDFVRESPIVAHAYKNERDFLDYEFARAKVIEWGESAYAEERYICTQVLFAQLFPGSSKSLTSMCDRLVLARRIARRRHDCRCAHTDGAPTQAWRERCAEIVDLRLTGMMASSICAIQPITRGHPSFTSISQVLSQ